MRLIPFEAVDNFRDYGDYATAAGRRIRPGRLYRSAHHARATDADLERLKAMDVGVVVDLRRPSERLQQPSRRHAGFSALLIESDEDDGGEAPHITFLKTQDLTPDSGRRFMTATYRELPFVPAHVDMFRRYFQAVADSERPVVIHCAAGKDRTGMLAAVTHHVLGVSHDDLIEDYLLTNTAVDLAARAPKIAEQLKAFTGREASHDAVVAFLGVEAAYLDAAFDEMRARCGGLDGYVDRVLGIDAAMRDRIAERLTA
ncbi:MAG: tyrosine-protein phosphatase [Brevundimonas sp.]